MPTGANSSSTTAKQHFRTSERGRSGRGETEDENGVRLDPRDTGPSDTGDYIFDAEDLVSDTEDYTFDDDVDALPTSSLLSAHQRSNHRPRHSPESIPLETMYRPHTARRSFSSKRISRRDSDSESEDEQQYLEQRQQGQLDSQLPAEESQEGGVGGRPSTLQRTRSRGSNRRMPSYRRRPSNRRFPSQRGPSEAGPSGDIAEEADNEPIWQQVFEEGRPAKENKSLAISAELDEMGMGRYQWCIFFLCGLGFFIDLLWAQMFGLITVPLRNEVGFGAGDGNIGTLSTSFNVGLTVGAFCWGLGVDVVGRRWSFYLTCLISGVFGIASGAPPTFTGLRVLTAFVGFGVGGNIPIDCTVTLEFLPTNRHFLLALLSVFQPMGTLISSGIAYAFIPRYSCGGGEEVDAAAMSTCTKERNMGWRYSLHTIGAITLFVFFIRFFCFNFRESPAYLINRGEDEKALKVLHSIAKMNKAPAPRLTMADFRTIEKQSREAMEARQSDSTSITAASANVEGPPSKNPNADETISEAHSGTHVLSQTQGRSGDDSDEELQEKAPIGITFVESIRETFGLFYSQILQLRTLFMDFKMARITTVMFATYIADFFGFNIAGVFLPLILSDRGIAAGDSLSDTYRDYVAIYAPGILACLLSCALIEVPRVGRQWVMIVSSALMAAMFFTYTRVDTQALSVVVNALEYFFQSLFNAILYATTAEYYPSKIRGSACGICSTIGRISGIVAPLIGEALYGANGGDASGATRVLYLGGGITLLCPVALLFLPYDTRGKRSM